jgi:hypothetical protein
MKGSACVTPSGRTDQHGKYVCADQRGGWIRWSCSFCKAYLFSERARRGNAALHRRFKRAAAGRPAS